MSEIMNISVNGQSQVPPGFRFHPTEEELLHYYLRKKISHLKIDLDVIHEVDLNKLEPWDIQARCKIGTTAQTDWYFFSHRDKKYPSGTRRNRATTAGFWKATGRDKVIYKSNSRSRIIGMRKTLVFYTGRAPNGQKSDWIMYEYRMDDSQLHIIPSHDALGETQHDEGWVVCRIFKKRNHQQQVQDYSNVSASINVAESRTQQIIPSSPWDHEDEEEEEEKKVDTNSTMNFQQFEAMMIKGSDYYDAADQEAVSDLESSKITKWEAVDQLVACQLNGKTEEGIYCDIAHFGGYFLY